MSLIIPPKNLHSGRNKPLRTDRASAAAEKQQRKITTENALREKIGVTKKVIRLQRKCRYLVARMNIISC